MFLNLSALVSLLARNPDDDAVPQAQRRMWELALHLEEASPDRTARALADARRALRETVELLSSMRFAISLLTVIAIASVIGTVLKQNEPYPNYVNQFGPFWAEVFRSLTLPTVYSAWWFLLILTFLVVLVTMVYGPIAAALVELFPTRIRARAVGFVYAWSRLSTVATSFMIAFFLRDFGVPGVFAFMAASMGVVMLAIGGFGPRTRGLPLEAISP